MRIRDIHIDGFGVWNDLRLEELPPAMTVFYGPNEAGKSTLLQFVRTVLYGYSAERRNRYVPPVYGGRPGGEIQVHSSLGNFLLQRTTLPGEKEDHPGQMAVLDENGTANEGIRLRELLGGIDESTFNHVFAIGLREIQELGTLHDNAAADLLYQLTSGMDRVSLVEVAHELADSRERLWAGEDKHSQITDLEEKRDRLQVEIDELTARGWKYTDLAAQREALALETEKLGNEIVRLDEDLDLLEAAQSVRDPWLGRIDIDKKLHAFGNIPVVPESAVARVEGLSDKIRRLEKLRRSWRKKSKAILSEKKALPFKRLILANAQRIEALQEHAQWIATLEGQVERLTEEVRKFEAEIHGQVSQLGLPPSKGGLNEETAFRILAALKSPYRSLRTATERHEHARVEAENSRREADRALHSAELASGRMPVDLTAAIQEAGQRVGLLRRRIQLEEQLDSLNRSRDELEEDADFWLSRQLMPPWMQFWVGVAFIFGVMFLLTGMIGPMVGWISNGFPLFITGLVMCVGSTFSKIRWEREATVELDECRRQLNVVYRELAGAKEERDDIDSQLPTGGGALDARLHSAESELRELERLAPMETLRNASVDRSAALGRRVTETADALEEARTQWRAALKSVGLPEDFDPARLKQIASQGDDIAELRRRRDQRREELDQREKDLLTLAGRVEQVLTDVELPPETSRPQTQLRQLSVALARQREIVTRRRELALRLTDLKRKYAGGIERLRKYSRSRAEIFSKAQVDTEEGLRRRVTDSQQIRELRKERERLTTDIQARLNGKYTEDVISGVLVGGLDRVDKRRKELNTEIQQTRIALAQLHEKRGAYKQEMELLVADRRLSQCRIELSEVEVQLAAAGHRWRVLTVVETVLEDQMRAYEREKQPATLREASEYLQRLTNGQYVRIWTPLSERALQIEDSKGDSLPVDLLSRGTREAIYLALRLALVSQYERKGILLPLVLDDVLVNFDTTRVKAASKVLRDFAREGRQILMFTCHEHIMRIFRESEVEVRVLPARHGLPAARLEPEPVAALPPPPVVVLPAPKPVVTAVKPPLPMPNLVHLPPIKAISPQPAPSPNPRPALPMISPLVKAPPPPVYALPLPPLPPPPVIKPIVRVEPPRPVVRAPLPPLPPPPVLAPVAKKVTLPPLPPPPIVRRVDPPAKKKKKRIVVPTAPPKQYVDPNALFMRAAVEEQWYDPAGTLPRPVAAEATAVSLEPISYHIVSTIAEPFVQQDDSTEMPSKILNRSRRRFTWESPEMYLEE